MKSDEVLVTCAETEHTVTRKIDKPYTMAELRELFHEGDLVWGLLDVIEERDVKLAMAETRITELEKMEGKTSSGVVLALLEHTGMDEEKARSTFWSALSHQIIELDSQLRVAKLTLAASKEEADE